MTSSTFGASEKEAMLSVINSDMYTMGSHVKEFEGSFADYFGRKYAVMVNSGSSANLIATASLFYRGEGENRLKERLTVLCLAFHGRQHFILYFNTA